jgi:hypothetical protein
MSLVKEPSLLSHHSSAVEGFNGFDIRLIIRGNIAAVLEQAWQLAREFGVLVKPTF